MCNPDLDAEFDSLRPGESTEQGATRRTALKAAIGVGYAAATLPVTAQTAIRTSAEGLKAAPIKYKVNGFDVPAYAAAPAGKTELPVVLVIQEIFGVHEYIADTRAASRKAGYLAIAPELYARQGDPRTLRRHPEAAGRGGQQGARCAGDGRPRRRAALCGGQRRRRRQGRPSPASAGAGASSGSMRRPARSRPAWPGTAAWSASPANSRPGTRSTLPPNCKAPVLGLYGGKDQGIPLDTVDKMNAALATGTPAAKASQFVVYPEAGHAFHADYRPSYVASAAEDGWKRALAWFKANGVV